MRRVAALAILLLAAPAAGQSVDVRVKRDVPAKRCSVADYLLVPTLGIAPHCQERAAAADRKAALALVADGKCPEAIAAALRIGDLTLAKEVRGFCATPPSAADPTGPAPASH